MNFEWTEGHRAFRQKAKDLLAEHLPADWAAQTRYDQGSIYAANFSRKFCPILAREGMLLPHWPREFGGSGMDPFYHWILGEEMAAVGEPRSYQYMYCNWVGPAIMAYGTEAQKQAHLPRMTTGNVIWCQGFSEPSAGSDLAALSTRAERTANGYVINGSKIWTSGASVADFCFLLARTGDKRNSGISVFLLPMDTKGIDVRVIKTFMGATAFHEVFLTDVEVPESARLGEENRGWQIVRHVMYNERIGAPRYMLTLNALDHAVALLKAKNRFGDDMTRMRAGRARGALNAARTLCHQVIGERVKGRPPGPLTNVARYAVVMADRHVAEFIGDYLHEELVTNDDPLIAAAYRRTGSTGFAAGAAEIQLNLISRDLLQLPRVN